MITRNSIIEGLTNQIAGRANEKAKQHIFDLHSKMDNFELANRYFKSTNCFIRPIMSNYFVEV